MYEFRFDEVLPYLPFLLKGAKITVQITVIAMAFGMVFGLVVAFGRMSRFSVVRGISSLYINLFRSTPLLVQLVWIYFVLPILLGYSIPALVAGTVALSLYVSAYIAEIYRSGIRSVDYGQTETSFALGMTRTQTMRRTVLPQAVVRMLPPLGSMFVTLFKESALVSAIGVADLLRQGLSLSQYTIRPVEVLTVTALMYLVLTWMQTLWVNALHRRLLSH